jgi:hypothetical protein
LSNLAYKKTNTIISLLKILLISFHSNNSQRPFLDFSLTVSVSHRYLIIGPRLEVFPGPWDLILVVNKFIFLFLFHNECGPSNIFGLSKNEDLIDHQENQSHNKTHNGYHHEYDMRDEIGVRNGCGYWALGFFRHEDENYDKDGGDGDTDDGVDFWIGGAATCEAPDYTESDCDNDDESANSNTCDFAR